MSQIVLGALIALFGAALGYGAKIPGNKKIDDRLSLVETTVDLIARRPPMPAPMPPFGMMATPPQPRPQQPRPQANPMGGQLVPMPRPEQEPAWVQEARARIQAGGAEAGADLSDPMAAALRQMAMLAQSQNRI